MTISRRHPQATVLGACILAVLASAAANAAPADEQAAATTTPKAAEKAKDQEVAEVVVTGSRLRRTEFTAASPVQIITTEQTSLEGLMSAAEILQSSTLASGSQQINDQTTGFVTENGPGANTLSLRGLGASRTLVLLNGRRLSPAGSRGQLAAADLNVIPESIIQRIEILKDGASSVYGSDAIAGVVNIITRKGIDGGNISVEGNYVTQGGGESRQLSASWGKTWEEGGFSVSYEFFKREPLRVGDRDFLACAQDRVTNVTTNPNSVFFGSVGQPLDVIDPATGQSKCFNLLSGIAQRGAGGNFIPDGSAVLNGGILAGGLGFRDLAGWRRVGQSFAQVNSAFPNASLQDRLNKWYQVTAAMPYSPPEYLNRTFNSPVDRHSVYAEGSWEFSPALNVYAEALFNKRESKQESYRQLFPYVSGFMAINPFGGGFTPSRPVITIPYGGEQEVKFKRYVVGANGEFSAFNGNTWKYDVFFQRTESDAAYTGDIVYNDRVDATTGWVPNFIEPGVGYLAGNSPCDASLITISGPTPCTPVNWFRGQTILTGQFTPEEKAFLFGRETGHTKYDQNLYGASINGTLFSLPAGDVSAAVGFEGRKDSINDTPGLNSRNRNIWGLTTSGITTGSDQVKEFFGEMEVPLLKGIPGIKQLSLNASARWTDYDSFGSDTTYKLGLNWQVTDTIRLRASHGTSFRAPALFELFLGDQSGFQSQGIDPCNFWNFSSDVQIQANCGPTGIDLPENWQNLNSSALVLQRGAQGLNAETSKAYTAGIVWTPESLPISIAADWWRIEVANQVTRFGAANIAFLCYADEDFPNSPYCSQFERNLDPESFEYGKINNVVDSYVNIANQVAEGVDYSVRFQKKFGAYTVSSNVQVTYQLVDSTQLFESFDPENNADTIYSNKWVSSIDTRIERGPWTLNWSIDAFSRASNDRPFGGDTFGWRGFSNCGTQTTPTTTCVEGRYDQTVLNEDPPLLSTGSGAVRVGNAIGISNYDILGRRFFLSADYRF